MADGGGVEASPGILQNKYAIAGIYTVHGNRVRITLAFFLFNHDADCSPVQVCAIAIETMYTV